jgi:HEPN domain-containing protein
MSPQLEEALRFLRISADDRAAFEILAANNAAHSVTIFHAQQSVEKAIKSLLYLHGIEFRRSHDLELLVKLLEPVAACPVSGAEFRRLTPYAVECRYDDEPAGLLTISEARRIMNLTYDWAKAIVDAGVVP